MSFYIKRTCAMNPPSLRFKWNTPRTSSEIEQVDDLV